MADLKAVPDLQPSEEFPPLVVHVLRHEDVLKASDALMYWTVAQDRTKGLFEVMDCPSSTVREALSVEGVYDYDVTALGEPELKQDAG